MTPLNCSCGQHGQAFRRVQSWLSYLGRKGLLNLAGFWKLCHLPGLVRSWILEENLWPPPHQKHTTPNCILNTYISVTLIPHLLALDGDHSRKPQLVRIQRTTVLGWPAPTDISATQERHLRLREDCVGGVVVRKPVRGRWNLLGSGSFRNDRSVHSRYLNNTAASTRPTLWQYQ